MPTSAALARRLQWNPTRGRILGSRRPPENGSSVILTPDNHWRLNFRVDVIRVGKETADALEPGDIILVEPRGDHLELDKTNDPSLIMTWNYRDGFNHNKVLGIIRALPVVHIKTLTKCRAQVIDHRWDWEVDGVVTDLVPGDYLVTFANGYQKPVRKADFPKEYGMTGQIVAMKEPECHS